MTNEHHNLASPGAGADSSSAPRLIAPGAGFFMGVNMESLGWIKLHRKMVDWEWYTSANTMRVFVHLLLTANHAEQKWQGVTVKRGQVICGRHSLAKALNISEQKIKTALRCLKSTSEITIKSTNRFSIVTLCNYDTYQTREKQINQPINQPANQQSTSNQPASNHKQEGEEGKNDKNILPPPVELPKSFPQTELAARRSVGPVGCPEQFAADVWNKATSRGGKDSRGQVIESFPHYLATEWKYERERMEKNRETGQPTGGKKPLSVFDRRSIIEAKMTQAKEIKRVFCSDVAMGESWNNKSKRAEYYGIMEEIRKINNEIAKMA